MSLTCTLWMFFANYLGGSNCRNEALVGYVNSMNATWTAEVGYAGHVQMSDVSKMLGGLHDNRTHLAYIRRLEGVLENKLPDNFNATHNWPFCTSIGKIVDQGSCGSCWAIQTASAMTDRTCISSGGAFQDTISAEDILSCCTWCGSCDGGFASLAWAYWVRQGVVSGSDYNLRSGCKPYSFRPCSNANDTKRYCPEEWNRAPDCETKCATDYKVKYEKDKHFGRAVYYLSDERQIRLSIYRSGPVTSTMEIYKDLLFYKKGVYHHVIGERLGNHVVKIIGWGKENGVPYWLVSNSWSTLWGELGFFKILRGTNEANIEGSVIAGDP